MDKNFLILKLTNLKPLRTLRPSTNSNIISSKEAVTIIKSKIFQPHKKKSLDKAISFTMHSKVNIEVKTWNNIIIYNIQFYL